MSQLRLDAGLVARDYDKNRDGLVSDDLKVTAMDLVDTQKTARSQ